MATGDETRASSTRSKEELARDRRRLVLGAAAGVAFSPQIAASGLVPHFGAASSSTCSQVATADVVVTTTNNFLCSGCGQCGYGDRLSIGGPLGLCVPRAFIADVGGADVSFTGDDNTVTVNTPGCRIVSATVDPLILDSGVPFLTSITTSIDPDGGRVVVGFEINPDLTTDELFEGSFQAYGELTLAVDCEVPC